MDIFCNRTIISLTKRVCLTSCRCHDSTLNFYVSLVFSSSTSNTSTSYLSMSPYFVRKTTLTKAYITCTCKHRHKHQNKFDLCAGACVVGQKRTEHKCKEKAGIMILFSRKFLTKQFGKSWGGGALPYESDRDGRHIV